MSLQTAIDEFNKLCNRAVREDWASKGGRYAMRVASIKKLSNAFKGKEIESDLEEELSTFRIPLAYPDSNGYSRVFAVHEALSHVPLLQNFNRVKTLSQLYPQFFKDQVRITVVLPERCAEGSMWVSSLFGKIVSAKKSSYELSLAKIAEATSKYLVKYSPSSNPDV